MRPTLHNVLSVCNVEDMTNNTEVTKTISAMPPAYRAEFAALGDKLEAIAAKATRDQQAGTPLMRGRAAYSETIESAHYQNSWLASIRVNGIAKKVSA